MSRARRPPGRAEAPETFTIGGRRPVLEALEAHRARRVLLARGVGDAETVRRIRELAAAGEVPLEAVDRSLLDALRLGEHQGVAADVVLPDPLEERALLEHTWPDDALLVALDGVTDPQNLGASARAAEAAGASALLSRARRAAPLTPAAVKASAGALLHLPVTRVTNLAWTLEALKDRRFTVVGLDGSAEATIGDPAPARPLILVVGAEGGGLSRLVRERCDVLVRIPMAGRTASLNAAAALAVGLFAYAARAQPG